MAIQLSNSFVNTSKTYKVDRLLPERSDTNGWAACTKSGSSYSAVDGHVPKWIYPGTTDSTGSSVQLSMKSSKAGETQYVSAAKDGLSPIACVKVGTKNVPDVYGYSVLGPDKLANKLPGVQAVVSLEELYRASRITKITPGEGGSETYECNSETGHLPISGWLCVRAPKHSAITEDVLRAFICDLLGTFTANGANANTSFTKQIMSLLSGDVIL